MVTTGYVDTFNRSVSNGLGTATSGQAYTLSGAATQFSVAPSTAQIAIATAGDKMGYIDLQTQDVDISGQVALSAIPATNLATVGFCAKLSSANNYFVGSMMVATGGAISLRFSKVVSGSLVTISTTSTGLTYVANTFYNLRYAIRWSQALQTNVMQLKLWAIGADQPGGWMATSTDASFTQYTSGTSVGIHTRDESTVVGTITSKYQSVSSYSYALPMPASTDPMCYDPAFAYPRQTALESLADAADAAMTSLDPLVSLAGLFPRVRVSASNFTFATSAIFIAAQFTATEFNVGTPTNLAQDSGSIYLSPGIWLVTFEIRMTNASSNDMFVLIGGLNAIGTTQGLMRTNASQTNDDGVGGTGHFSQYGISIDPTSPTRVSVTLNPSNLSATYTVAYMALSAIKVSDYFT